MGEGFLGRFFHNKDNGAGARGGELGTAADVSAPELATTATADVKAEGAADSSMEPKSPPTDLQMETPEPTVAVKTETDKDSPMEALEGDGIPDEPKAVDEPEPVEPAAMKPAEMREPTVELPEIKEPAIEPMSQAGGVSGRDNLLNSVRSKAAAGSPILPEGSMPDMDSEPPIEEDVHPETQEEPETEEGVTEVAEKLTSQRVIEVVAEVLEQPVGAVSEASTMEDLKLWTDKEPGGAIDVDSFDRIKEQLGVERLKFDVTATATVANLIGAIRDQMPHKIQ